MKATIQSKMRLNKCDAYTAKETLGYRGRKFYMSAAKRAEKKRGTEEEKKDYRQTIGAPP